MYIVYESYDNSYIIIGHVMHNYMETNVLFNIDMDYYLENFLKIQNMYNVYGKRWTELGRGRSHVTLMMETSNKIMIIFC